MHAPSRLALAAVLVAPIALLALLLTGGRPAEDDTMARIAEADPASVELEMVIQDRERSAPGESHSSAEPPAADAGPTAYDHRTTIQGQVNLSTPGADPRAVRVVALPRSDLMLINPRAFRARLEAPDDHGWFVDAADEQGRFVLGPGLDPGIEYFVVAAGSGEVSTAGWAQRARAGDEGDLHLLPLVGIEIQAETPSGEPYPVIPTNHIADSGTPGRFSRGPVLAAGQTPPTISTTDEPPGPPWPSLVALAMLDLPTAQEGRPVIYAVDESRGQTQWVSRVGIHGLDLHRPQIFDVELRPLTDGLVSQLVIVDGFRQRDDQATVVLDFPEEFVELYLDGGDRTRICSSLEVQGIDSAGHWFGATFSPQFERGETTWTTTDIPPGEYGFNYHTVLNQWLWLRPEADRPATGARQEITVHPDRPTVLRLPAMTFAGVRITPLIDGPMQDQEFVSVTVEGPIRRAFARPTRDTALIPLMLPANRPSDRPWRLSTYRPDGVRALVDAEGRQELTIEPGQIIDLDLGPRLGPVPGTEEDR